MCALRAGWCARQRFGTARRMPLLCVGFSCFSSYVDALRECNTSCALVTAVPRPAPASALPLLQLDNPSLSYSPRTTSLTVQRRAAMRDSAEERFFRKLEAEVGAARGLWVPVTLAGTSEGSTPPCSEHARCLCCPCVSKPYPSHGRSTIPFPQVHKINKFCQGQTRSLEQRLQKLQERAAVAEGGREKEALLRVRDRRRWLRPLLSSCAWCACRTATAAFMPPCWCPCCARCARCPRCAGRQGDWRRVPGAGEVCQPELHG